MVTSLPVSIRYETSNPDGILTISIVDQLLLPHTVTYVPILSISDAHAAIKNMQIRGAPAIASLASLSVASELSRALAASVEGASTSYAYLNSPEELKAFIEPQLDFLYTSRPTAVNLGAAIKRLRRIVSEGVQDASSAADKKHAARSLAQKLFEEGVEIAREDTGRNREMSAHGAGWLVKQVQNATGTGLEDVGKLNVLTVCNTGSLATSGYGTALGLITHLFETQRLGTAYFTQTAPYHQGSRLTAFELQSLGIPHVMICDTMVGSLFQHHTIHAVAVGADRIARNGDTANKIGTYNAAVLAARHKVPFIVVAPISTVDLEIPDGSHIPIEQRPWLEACLVRGAVYPPEKHTDGAGIVEQKVVQLTPPGLTAENVYNPSFDVTPAELISAVVTEKGVAVRDAEGKIDLGGIV